jgi:hypothetical protein
MQIGFYLFEHWGVEVRFEETGLFGYMFEFEPTWQYVLSTEIYTATGNIRYRLPLGRWEPSMIFGAGITHGEFPGNKDNRAVIRYGPGVACRVVGGFYLEFLASGISVLDGNEGFDIYGVSAGLVCRLGPQKKPRSSN